MPNKRVPTISKISYLNTSDTFTSFISFSLIYLLTPFLLLTAFLFTSLYPIYGLSNEIPHPSSIKISPPPKETYKNPKSYPKNSINNLTLQPKTQAYKKSSKKPPSLNELKTLFQRKDPLKYLPIQSGGRIKPFDSFAKESLQLIYGKKSYKKQEATTIILTWMMIPNLWEKINLISIQNYQLKKDLDLNTKELRFSPKQIRQNEKIGILIQELQKKREKKEKLNPYFKAIERLENQMNLFYAISLHSYLPVAPSKHETAWKPISKLEGPLKNSFDKVKRSFTQSLADSINPDKISLNKKVPLLSETLAQFTHQAMNENVEAYADFKKIKTEVFYNNLKPFQLSWILYLLAMIFFFLSFLFKKEISKPKKDKTQKSTKKEIKKTPFYPLGWSALLCAFFIHSLGMILRVYIAGRPPVTNMYETMLWVPWGSVLLGLILELRYPMILPLLASTAVSTLCLILSSMAPTILDPSIEPLQAVLRDNFWLVFHVLTICLSYAAFALSLFLSDILVFLTLLNEKKYKTQIKEGVSVIYRSLQVGVLLLLIGTILGGLWADISWGRFWGWDPKETWALITLLGYLALLHGRIGGWLKDFGMLIGSIVAFSLVLMAWYGVNFILGSGLHSYGFSSGGMGFMFIFVSLHFLYVLYAILQRKQNLKNI